MKRSMIVLTVFVILLCTGTVLAAKPDSLPAPESKVFSLPPQAKEVAPGVYYLGKTFDAIGFVEGYAFIDYAPGFAKQERPAKPSRDPTCYTYLSKGTKWRVIEPYIVDPSNSRGLADNFISTNIAQDIGKWEDAAGYNILGDEINGDVNGPDTVITDNKNEIMFGDIGEDNAIAITIVWGTFSAPLPYRQLVEWDQVYDDVDFDWSNSGAPDKMDFENIATHELGHSVGMGDLYTPACSEQTMYGYAIEGETKKSTLETGDILGIQSLY